MLTGCGASLAPSHKLFLPQCESRRITATRGNSTPLSKKVIAVFSANAPGTE